jgi:hypothetical protein
MGITDPQDSSPADGRIDLRTPFPKTGFEPATLVDLLRWRASHEPERRAYTFLGGGEAEEPGPSLPGWRPSGLRAGSAPSYSTPRV